MLLGSGHIDIMNDQDLERFRWQIHFSQRAGIGYVCEHLAGFTVSENALLPIGTSLT